MVDLLVHVKVRNNLFGIASQNAIKVVKLLVKSKDVSIAVFCMCRNNIT